MAAHDITGQRFENLIAVKKVGKKKNGNSVWLFVCDCGGSVETESYSVKTGKVRSCKTCGAIRSRTASITHGMTNSSEYRIWTGMKTRCFNQNSRAFKDYGGRGVTMCESWACSFDAFLADMGPRPSDMHSIDRVDVNGNYDPSNCRWATKEDQANNKRTNRIVESSAGKKTVAEAAREAGLTYGCLHHRLKSESAETATARKTQTGGTLTHDGITDTFHGWSNRTGIKVSTISMRIHKYGWPIAKALTKGALL